MVLDCCADPEAPELPEAEATPATVDVVVPSLALDTAPTTVELVVVATSAELVPPEVVGVVPWSPPPESPPEVVGVVPLVAQPLPLLSVEVADSEESSVLVSQ